MTENNKLTFASLCLLLCFLLPMLTGGHTDVSAALCLMHFPVMICGLICGAPWGVAVGVTAPVLRSLLFGMPNMYPLAVAMCLEMGVYGLVCGLLANDSRKEAWHIILDMLLAMVAGRLVWGLAMAIFSIGTGDPFTLADFKSAVESTWPGIALQLMGLPPLTVFLQAIFFPDEIQTI